MNDLIPFIWLAGGVQLLIASANLFAPRIFRYRENLEKVSPIVREVFIVHSLYIVTVVVALAMTSLLFAADLAGQSLLGRFLSAFLALFWGLRVLIQVFLYDHEIKRRHPIANLLFIAAFLYLLAVFGFAAMHPMWAPGRATM